MRWQGGGAQGRCQGPRRAGGFTLVPGQGEGGILERLGWKLESNSMVEGPADSALMKYLKKHHSVTGQIGTVHHLIDAVRRTQHHLLLISLHNLNLVMRKHQTNPNRGTATG